MTLLPLLIAVCAVANAQEFRLPVESAALVAGARALAARPQAPVKPASFQFFSLRATAQVTPINQGFRALGPAGATGQVKAGPFGVGNGTYRVAANDPYQILLDVKTNYVDGRFTLKRDATTGQDSLGFAGRLKDPNTGTWSDVNSLKDGSVTYDAGSDSGAIGWTLQGKSQKDNYHDGASGGDMTISLSGHDHEFIRN
jgi:hypothetical protein